MSNAHSSPKLEDSVAGAEAALESALLSFWLLVWVVCGGSSLGRRVNPP